MNLHRFLVSADIALGHDLWIHDKTLVKTWNDLHLEADQRVVLFDGAGHDKLYKLVEITPLEAHFIYITDFEQKLPEQNIYFLWPPERAADVRQILEVGTQQGVSHFLPLITDETLEPSFDHAWAQEVVLHAAEGSGRSDVPTVREPLHLAKALDQLQEKVTLYICGQEGGEVLDARQKNIGLIIAPAHGWSKAEEALAQEKQLKQFNVTGVGDKPVAILTAALQKLH
jgi:RsmE family RNA methyltransferase